MGEMFVFIRTTTKVMLAEACQAGHQSIISQDIVRVPGLRLSPEIMVGNMRNALSLD